ncbi:hypothetical protein [Rhizobium herbae]
MVAPRRDGVVDRHIRLAFEIAGDGIALEAAADAVVSFATHEVVDGRPKRSCIIIE